MKLVPSNFNDRIYRDLNLKSKLIKNKNTVFTLTAVLIIIVSFIIPALALSKLPPQIPLWYSLPWGESQLAPKTSLFLLPVISMIFLIFNLLFPHFINLKDEKEENPSKEIFLKESFVFVSLAVSFISLITIVKIVGLFL